MAESTSFSKGAKVMSAYSVPASLAATLLCVLLAGAAAPAPAQGTLSGDRIAGSSGDIVIHPVNHATMVIGWKGHVIYVDPVGGAERFAGLPRPDVILITDIHPDHLDNATLSAIAGESKLVGAPAAVEQLAPSIKGKAARLANGETLALGDFSVEAVAAYNLTADRLKFHSKGRGNGYILSLGGKRLYLSGDTEDIPEMRALRNIDIAFVCMNLPYTMTPEQAASAVREFRPKVVYPYHSKGSDLEKFKALVGADSGVEVRLRNWY
jgi:L-ascorbate metabolism protein UlaG (beta-lactamase superfamily)